MRRLFALLALASLLITCEATTADYKHGKSVSVDFSPAPRFIGDQQDSNSRRLRTSRTINVSTEERAFPGLSLTTLSNKIAQSKLKLPKPVQFRIYLKAKWDPAQLYKHFGFAGKSLDWVKKQPNFLVYLGYSKFWNAKGGRYM
ncbi:RxLR effector protein [Phytophthora megakarya]|uniref:RxLR effector protein n=1 Tax=Phytophthora megakarya TaxID=4795 RepID=A0A225VCY1_9STRA|nr:RxLR effector protein [Phytophthora megakarya]